MMAGNSEVKRVRKRSKIMQGKAEVILGEA